MNSPNNSNNENNEYSNLILSDEESSVRSSLMWETFGGSCSKLFCQNTNNISISRSNTKFIIKVFAGGLSAIQLGAFQIALKFVIDEVKNNNPGNVQILIKYISTQDVSIKKWLPKQLIDYLLDSDLHFILSHIHQGLTSRNIGWIIPSLMKHLKRLTYHYGFPTGSQLFCPVFTQDKIRYIQSLDFNFSIPTYEMRITIPGATHSQTEIDVLKELIIY